MRSRRTPSRLRCDEHSKPAWKKEAKGLLTGVTNAQHSKWSRYDRTNGTVRPVLFPRCRLARLITFELVADQAHDMNHVGRAGGAERDSGHQDNPVAPVGDFVP